MNKITPESMIAPTPSYPMKVGKVLFFVILSLYLVDQLTKGLIVHYFALPMYPFPGTNGGMIIDQVPVIDNFFSIIRIHNTGVAFGMGNGTEWASYVFLAIPIIAGSLLYVLYRRGFFNTIWLRIAWALITVGILGNLTDRLIQGFLLPGAGMRGFWENLLNGYVVDFLDVGPIPWTNGWHWPAFNVADSCICIAAAIFFISSFFMKSDTTTGKK